MVFGGLQPLTCPLELPLPWHVRPFRLFHQIVMACTAVNNRLQAACMDVYTEVDVLWECLSSLGCADVGGSAGERRADGAGWGGWGPTGARAV